MNCIFCKIINKEIESYVIYEDDCTLAFLDISQTTLGHTLVVPKKHATSIYDEVDVNFLTRIPYIAKHIKEKLNAEGINIVNNSGSVAGQTVNHVHFHLVPRYGENDKFRIDFSDSSSSINKDELMQLKDKLEVIDAI